MCEQGRGVKDALGLHKQSRSTETLGPQVLHACTAQHQMLAQTFSSLPHMHMCGDVMLLLLRAVEVL